MSSIHSKEVSIVVHIGASGQTPHCSNEASVKLGVHGSSDTGGVHGTQRSAFHIHVLMRFSVLGGLLILLAGTELSSIALEVN